METQAMSNYFAQGLDICLICKIMIKSCPEQSKRN